MKFSSSHPIQFAAAVLALLICNPAIRAQQPPSRDLASIRSTDRVLNVIDDNSTVLLPFRRHPLAKPEFDLGGVPPAALLERMMLVLQPDDLQQAGLERLLAEQQDPESPNYHRWLSPEDFGRSYGISRSDYDRLTKWLETQGFEVEPPDAALRVLLFGGTAEQVQTTFSTKIHAFRVGARVHWTNVTPPSLPQALAGVVHGFVSLHDFGRQALSRLVPLSSIPAPELTSGMSHYLAPADFAKIYDVSGLYSNSMDGTGQSIAVIGRSNIKIADIRTFRSTFGLPVNDPTVILNGTDPGILSSLDEQAEAQLDVEWSGAVARGAAIKMIVSASTRVSDGIDLSAQYAVNHNIAPVITVSFGSCESGMGSSENQFYNALWQQAAAQGITVLVSSGDSGAGGCDDGSSSTAAQGAAVNGLCSSPFSTCVGGTQFNDISNPAVYWLPTNTTGTYGSALGYIPETTWNESGSVSGGSGLWSSSGGASAIYAKPAWQTGMGVPADGRRDVPDVSLNAASHDGYVVILNGSTYVVGGTSVAAPSLAGLLTLVVQHQAGRVGNANPALYQLASLQAKGGANVFHDVTSGSNSVPGLIGFSATTGYDRATGLGSVDAMLMVNHWSDASTMAVQPLPAFQLTTSAVGISVTQGTKTSVPVTLTVSGGFNAPIGLSISGLPSGLAAVFAPSFTPIPGSGSSTLTFTSALTVAPGIYPLTLTAMGGGLSKSTALSVMILRSCTFVVTPLVTTAGAPSGNYSAAVTATTGCIWSATSTATWITVTAGSSGIGNGAVGYAVSANSTSTSRKGILTIAGQTLSVTQAATTAAQPTAPLILKASVSLISVPAAGGVVPVTVIATPTTSAWTAVSSASWISIVSGAGPAAGSRSVSISVSANNSGTTRAGTITMGSISIPVNQAGVVCSYATTIGPLSPALGGTMGSVAVATSTGCAWTSTSNVGWITIQSGKTGSGSGTTTFLVANNTSSTARTGMLTIAGRTITLTESKNASLRLASQ